MARYSSRCTQSRYPTSPGGEGNRPKVGSRWSRGDEDMAEAGAERFEALLTPAGRELLDHLAAEAMPPDTVLADTVPAATALRLGTQLRRRYPAGLVAAAVAQHELRLQARAKFSRAMQMYFTRPGLEQASAEVVARHRAARYSPFGRVADLCCGIGGDLLALAQAIPAPGGPAQGRHVL